jgi:hypothetical protein
MAVKLQQHSLLQLGKADRQIPAPVWLPVRVGSDAPAVDAGQFLAVTAGKSPRANKDLFNHRALLSEPFPACKSAPAGESQEVLEAQLRGRQLRGKTAVLPCPRYQFLVDAQYS